jgi:copper(I)-binding protein
MRLAASFLALALGASASLPVLAQVTVKDAWVRATVPQQKATGAFMQLTAAQDSKLISVSSSAVPIVEVHEMTMDGGVMKMRAIPSLALPAGKAVALRPGGYHVMLMDLKQAMKAGDVVPLTLVVENATGKRETVEVKAEVRAAGAAAAKADEHKH